MNDSRSVFKIDKVYADCIDEDGNCFIVYNAELHFLFFRFYYAALIFSNSSDVVLESSTFKKAEIKISEDEFYFNNKALEINGTWKCTDKGILRHLYKDLYNRELVWNCHHPKNYTSINYKSFTCRGFGYAERISLEFKPWNLPIDKLYWGRYLSATDTIIWIVWKGSFPLNKIFRNNVEYHDALIEENKIEFDKGQCQLVFNEVSIIREAELSRALTNVPWLKALFKRSILNSVESKFKARCIFSSENKIMSTGWSLYETVIWKH